MKDTFKSLRYIAIALLGLAVLASTFILNVNKAEALGDVTLQASAFSDDDAEDTHKASQWVVRDSGSTVYDSGTDTVNKTSITIPAATFSAGTTYYWKVRFQDQHDAWSLYSDESSFTYGSAPTPTPTPTPSPTPSPSATLSSTVTSTSTTTITSTVSATTTTSSTSTASSTASTFVSPVPSITPQPVICSQDIEITSADYNDSTGEIEVSFREYNSKIKEVEGQELTDKIDDLINDIYISFGEDSLENFRLAFDIDYIDSYHWEFMPGYGCEYLAIDASLDLPDNLIPYTEDFSKARVIAHAYENLGYSWGDSITLKYNWVPYALDPDMADRSGYFDLPQFSPDPYIIAEDCHMDVILPKKDQDWKIGRQETTTWNTDNDYQGVIDKVNISLSKNGGEDVSDIILLSGDDLGFYELKVLSRYKTNNAVLQYVGLDKNGNVVSFCKSDKFNIVGGIIPFDDDVSDSPIIPAILFLGSIAAIIPLIMSAISMAPGLARLISRIGVLFMPPAWPREKKAWGIVYDASNKKPIKGVVLRIYSEPDGRHKDVQVSNDRGEFGFFVPPGKYSITATSSKYEFPSHIVLGETDGRYVDIYRGGTIEASPGEDDADKGMININIPMDPAEMPVLDAAILAAIGSISRFFRTIRIPVMIIGTLATMYLLLQYSRVIDWVVLGIYILLWILELRDLFKNKAYGVVEDGSGNPVDLAVVRAMDMKGKIIASMVTDQFGKFYTNLNSGRYIFSVSKAGYSSSRTEPVNINKSSDLHRVSLTIEKLSREEGTIHYKTSVSS